MKSSRIGWSACVALVVVSIAGCGDDETGAAAGGPASGSGGSSSASGGSGAGAGGAGGGAGGGEGACLPASAHEDVLSIAEETLCVTARHSAPVRVGLDPNTFQSVVPTWGRHDGPLLMEQTFENGAPVNEIALSRFSVPSGAGGPLGGPLVEGPLAPSATASAPFMSPAAVDLPFASWTAVGWASFGSPDGEAIMLDGAAVAQTFTVAGLFSFAGVAGAADEGRLFHASLTGLGDANAAPSPAVRATDLCGSAPCDASIVLFAGGDASGPMVLDSADNLFALLPSLAAGTQALRGWAAARIAPGTPAHEGEALATLDGSGTALAAMAPADSSPGYVFAQPLDGGTFVLGDVIAQRYRVEADAVVPEGSAAPALTLAETGTEVTLTSDAAGRLWVGVVTSETPLESTFFVIDRAR